MKNSQKIKNIFVYFTILLFSLWIPAVRFSWSIPPAVVQRQFEKRKRKESDNNYNFICGKFAAVIHPARRPSGGRGNIHKR